MKSMFQDIAEFPALYIYASFANGTPWIGSFDTLKCLGWVGYVINNFLISISLLDFIEV